ncbi:MAG: hypothetical protein LW832_08810 [Parachlamydia sp.]|nr:hypothetical protein [Parachlamydia sp.]
MEKVVETVKGLLGFNDRTDKTRLDAEWMKFIYYGEVRGYLTDAALRKMRERIYYHAHPPSPSVAKLFRKVQRQHLTPVAQRLAHMQHVITTYHTENQKWLRPNFWSRMGHKPPPLAPLNHYGDTLLDLSSLTTDVREAFRLLQQAFYLKNTHPDFQQKMGVHLKSILERSRNGEIHAGERGIQTFWLELARTAYLNNQSDAAEKYIDEALSVQPVQETTLEAAEILLKQQSFEKAAPLLAVLEQARAMNAEIQQLIAKAYWHLGRFPEGVAAKEKAIRLLSNQRHLHFQTIASLHKELGDYYTTGPGFLTPDSAIQAALHFHEAYEDIHTIEMRQQVHLSYHKAWQQSPESFYSHSEKWLNFFTATPPRGQLPLFPPLFLFLAKEANRQNQNEFALECLEQGMAFYSRDENFVLEALQLCLTWEVAPPFTIDNFEFDHHPRIQELIGSLKWHSNKEEAILIYKRAIELYERDTEAQERAAPLHARIGSHVLKSPQGFFRRISYEEAFDHLKKAQALQPDIFSESLHAAYMLAAEEEMNKSFLTRNHGQAMHYYTQAFQTQACNGPYLEELMEHYLSKQEAWPEAIKLYQAIREQSWAAEAHLSAKQYHRLGKLFYKEGLKDLALECRQCAHAMDSANNDFKDSLDKTFIRLAIHNYNQAKSIDQLQIIADSLEQHLAIVLEEWKDIYHAHLALVYGRMAEKYKELFSLDQPICITTNLLAHQSKYAEEIQKAFDCYEKALSHQPHYSKWHFERGMLHDFKVEYDEALGSFRKAVQFNKKNPFYRKQLASTYHVLLNMKRYEAHENKLVCDANFPQVFRQWYSEYFMKSKSQKINPHKIDI